MVHIEQGEQIAPERLGNSRFRSLRKSASEHPLMVIGAVAIVVRLASSLLLFFMFDGILFGDEATYTNLAEQAAAGDTSLWNERDYSLYEATATFLLPLTALFTVLGPSILLGQVLAAAAGVAAAVVTTRLGLEVLPRGAALLAGGIVALLPSQVLFSSLALKDSTVWAILTALGLVVARANRAGSTATLGGYAAIGGGLLLALGFLRDHTLVVAAGAVVASFCLGPAARRLQRVSGAALALLLIPIFAGAGPAGIDVLRQGDDLGTRRELNAVGAETALVDPPIDRELPGDASGSNGEPPRQEGATDPQTSDAAPATPAPREIGAAPTTEAPSTGGIGADLRYLPRGLRAMIFEPVPWSSSNQNLRRASVDVLLWYPALVLALFSIPLLWRWRATLAFPVISSGGILVMYALSEGNLGTAFRHRGEVVWAVAVLAGAGMTQLVALWSGEEPRGKLRKLRDSD